MRVLKILPMIFRTPPKVAIAAGGAAASPLVATAARAADFSTLANPIYVSASGNHKALLKQASAVLSKATSPVTIVFQSYVSCVALDQANNGTSATASALYWDATGAETACEIPVTGVVPDAVMSDVYPSTCGVTLK